MLSDLLTKGYVFIELSENGLSTNDLEETYSGSKTIEEIKQQYETGGDFDGTNN